MAVGTGPSHPADIGADRLDPREGLLAFGSVLSLAVLDPGFEPSVEDRIASAKWSMSLRHRAASRLTT